MRGRQEYGVIGGEWHEFRGVAGVERLVPRGVRRPTWSFVEAADAPLTRPSVAQAASAEIQSNRMTFSLTWFC